MFYLEDDMYLCTCVLHGRLYAGTDPGGVEWVASHPHFFLNFVCACVLPQLCSLYMFTFPCHHAFIITEKQMCMRN